MIHLSSILSAVGERNTKKSLLSSDPSATSSHLYFLRAIELNVRGIEHIMEVAREHNLRVYAPSSIAAFGPSTPQASLLLLLSFFPLQFPFPYCLSPLKVKTPDEVIMRPTTIYGVSKVYLELLGEYYCKKFGVDFRSIRFLSLSDTVVSFSSLILAIKGTLEFSPLRPFLEVAQLITPSTSSTKP